MTDTQAPQYDEAAEAALFEQLQDALLGQTAITALRTLAECLAAVIVQGSDSEEHGRRMIDAVSADLREGFDRHWADPRTRAAALACAGSA